MHTQQEQSKFGQLGSAPEASSWAQQMRLRFIDFRLRWEGRLNRKDLEEFFGISAPQATNDFSAYQEGAPDNLKYDPKLKAYVSNLWFHPVYERSASRIYLNELLSLESGLLEPTASFLGWRPPIVVAPSLSRHIDGETMMVLLKAIREKRMVNVRYQTMGREEGTQRVLSPHGLAHDGSRWHIRAYCHMRKQFRDFVVARISAIELGTVSTAVVAEDMEWHTEVSVVIGPHSALSPASRAAIELDYGMDGGRIGLPCRHAMLFYTLRNLGLLNIDAAPPAQQLELINRGELEPYLRTLGHGFV